MQFDQLKRREFITLLGGAAAWPFAAHAQQAGKVPRIGFLGMASPSTFASRLEAFRLGLRDFGYIEGTTVNVEYRWADGRYERLPGVAAELVRSQGDLTSPLGHRETLLPSGRRRRSPSSWPRLAIQSRSA